jgi:hypothetical protein
MRRLMTRTTVLLAISGLFLGVSPSVGRTRVGIGAGKKDDAGARARLGLKLAAKLVKTLPRILEDFQARRQKLLASGGDAAYPRDGVAALLDSTEAAVKKELGKRELAPVRDYVEGVFGKARGDLGLSSTAAFAPTPVPQAVFASLRPVLEEPQGSLLDRSLAESVLKEVGAFLEDLHDRATKKDMTVNLCLVSEPKGARVSMKAKGSREVYKRKTSGPLQNLFRGKYFYTVEGKGFRIRCETPDCQIDLWNKTKPILECQQEEEEDCDLDEDWQKICRGR